MPKPDREPAIERLVSGLLYSLSFNGSELIDLRLVLSNMADRIEAGEQLGMADLDFIVNLYNRIGEDFDLPEYERRRHPAGTTIV